MSKKLDPPTLSTNSQTSQVQLLILNANRNQVCLEKLGILCWADLNQSLKDGYQFLISYQEKKIGLVELLHSVSQHFSS